MVYFYLLELKYKKYLKCNLALNKHYGSQHSSDSLEPRLDQIIRAGNPIDLREANVRELELSYFETQKLAKPFFP